MTNMEGVRAYVTVCVSRRAVARLDLRLGRRFRRGWEVNVEPRDIFGCLTTSAKRNRAFDFFRWVNGNLDMLQPGCSWHGRRSGTSRRGRNPPRATPCTFQPGL